MRRVPCRLSIYVFSAGIMLITNPAVGRAQLLGGLLGPSACTSSSSDCAIGSFSAPFAEPTINGVPTSEKCITDATGNKVCKPAAGTLALLRQEIITCPPTQFADAHSWSPPHALACAFFGTQAFEPLQ